jgi:phage I-like protein
MAGDGDVGGSMVGNSDTQGHQEHRRKMNNDKERNEHRHELTALDATRLGAKDVPTRVRLAPWGEVESTQGGFVVDEEGTRLAVEAFASHGTDLPVDYEHQTLGGSYASPNGQAPAAGWIKGLEVVPGEGLYALIEWTSPALTQLADKQYRYLSPVALVRRSDRKLVGLHSVALTNKPAIVGAEAIVNRASTATETIERLRTRLGLDDGCDVDTVLVAAGDRIEADARTTRLHNAEARVNRAVRAGKATDAQRAFAMRLAMTSPELFGEWLETAPVVVSLGRTSPPGGESDGGQRAMISAARAEYRAHPELSRLTSEEAFVAHAIRNDMNV